MAAKKEEPKAEEAPAEQQVAPAAEAPVSVMHGQSDRGNRIKHLLGTDDFELILVQWESEDALVVFGTQIVRPLQVRKDPLGAVQHGRNRARNAG